MLTLAVCLRGTRGHREHLYDKRVHGARRKMAGRKEVREGVQMVFFLKVTEMMVEKETRRKIPYGRVICTPYPPSLSHIHFLKGKP